MRVLYVSVEAGVTDHMPSVPSGPTFVKADAVPLMKYSCWTHPTRDRSIVGEIHAPAGLPTSSIVGVGTCARDVVAVRVSARMASTRRLGPMDMKFLRVVSISWPPKIANLPDRGNRAALDPPRHHGVECT